MAPQRRGRALVLAGGAAAAALAVALKNGLSAASAPGLAFAGGAGLPAARLAPRAAAQVPESRLPLRAEVVDAEEVPVDGEEEETSQPMVSVFDGATMKRNTIKQRYKNTDYRVFRANWTYEELDRDTGDVVKTGDWVRAFNMPQEAYEVQKPRLQQQWRAKRRRLRRKHGMGQRWPNGKLIFLAKLQGSPFTRERYGEKYIGRHPWTFHPNEVASRERQMRARELKRRMEQEAEEKRIARLHELGVWPGEQSWRRPWQPKVDLRPPSQRLRVSKGPVAAAAASE